MTPDFQQRTTPQAGTGSLRDVFGGVLAEVHCAERQMMEALPRMVAVASGERLQQELHELYSETRVRLIRLEVLFLDLQLATPASHAVHGAGGFMEEARTLLLLEGAVTVLDASLIAAVRRLAQCVVQAYSQLVALAKSCGLGDYSDLLEPSLEDAARAAMRFNALASPSTPPLPIARGAAWVS